MPPNRLPPDDADADVGVGGFLTQGSRSKPEPCLNVCALFHRETALWPAVTLLSSFISPRFPTGCRNNLADIGSEDESGLGSRSLSAEAILARAYLCHHVNNPASVPSTTSTSPQVLNDCNLGVTHCWNTLLSAIRRLCYRPCCPCFWQLWRWRS
jgi:hypothetical protein